MNWTDLNLMPAMPEIVLLSALGIVLLVDLWTSDKNRYITHVLSLLALVASQRGAGLLWRCAGLSAAPRGALTPNSRQGLCDKALELVWTYHCAMKSRP